MVTTTDTGSRSLRTTTTSSRKCSGDDSTNDPARLLKAFFEVRNLKLTPDALRMWLDALSDLAPEQLVDALRRFNRESTDYPTPAAVRRYAGAVAASLDDRATVAWSIVRREIRRTGAYESIEFDDRMINAAIRGMGGWERMCAVEERDLPFREKEFHAAYKAACRTGVGDGSPLLGITARGNAGSGFECPEPKRITTGLAEHPLAARLTYSETPERLRMGDGRPQLRIVAESMRVGGRGV